MDLAIISRNRQIARLGLSNLEPIWPEQFGELASGEARWSVGSLVAGPVTETESSAWDRRQIARLARFGEPPNRQIAFARSAPHWLR